MFSDLEKYIAGRVQLLPAPLKKHIQRTRRLGLEISAKYHVDSELVDISILGHDIARNLDDIALVVEAKKLRINIDEIEKKAPILLNGPIAATWISHNFLNKIDERIIEAIYFHTTGRANMSDVSKVIFLADKLDPEKIKRRPSLQEVKSHIDISLDQAILKFIELQINFSNMNNWEIPKMLLEFRDSLISKNT